MSSFSTAIHASLRSTVSSVRQRRLRVPSPFFLLSSRSKKARTTPERKLVQQLRRDGIIKLPGFVDSETLSDMQAGIERLVRTVDERRKKDTGPKMSGDLHLEDSTESFYDEESHTYISLDPFKYSTALVRFVMSDQIMSLVNSYYRKQALFARAMSFRNFPVERPRGHFTYQWHHDSWGRKVNATVLLSEIGEEDQYVAYKKGSHCLYHPIGWSKSPDFTDEEIKHDFDMYETLKCTGQPGDVYLFDANGLHTLTSSLGRTRDVYVLMYYGDPTFTFCQSIPDDVIVSSSSQDLMVFKETIKVNEQKRRTGSTRITPHLDLNWHSTLRYVRSWLF